MTTYAESEDRNHSDTEITLGMRSILGIFFGLALICGVFFGFGYSLGRGNTSRTIPPETAASVSANTADVKTVVEGSSPSNSDESESGTTSSTGDLSSRGTATMPAKPSASDAGTTLASSSHPAMGGAAAASQLQAAQGSTNTMPLAASSTTSRPEHATADPSAAIMVQIAAVSHREDADVLVSALSKLGYSASVRSDSSDNLLHVQVGPFATRDEAKAIRTKLINDGYNAILK